MSGEHAFLPPSGASAWVHCSMWPTMNAAYPEMADESKEEAEEGEAFHWLAASVLKDAERNPIPAGTRAPNGVAIDDEMIENLGYVLEAVAGDAPGRLNIEQRLTEAAVHSTLNWGTSDLWRFGHGAIDVWETKYGHEYVPEFENWQTVNYTGLIVALLKRHEILRPGESFIIRNTIIQPRCYTAAPIRTWTYTPETLEKMLFRMRGAAEEATSGTPVARTGDYCVHCPGRHACDALARSGARAADLSSLRLPMDPTPQVVGLELRMLKAAQARMEARITGLEAQAIRMLREGEPVPFVAMMPTLPREKWNAPVEEIVTLGQALGVDVAKPGVLTPAQARKAGLPEEVVAAFLEPRVAGMKLVIDDGTAARRAFGVSNG